MFFNRKVCCNLYFAILQKYKFYRVSRVHFRLIYRSNMTVENSVNTSMHRCTSIECWYVLRISLENNSTQFITRSILKAIKNATFYKVFSIQKVYMILEAMAIKVKNFCQAHFIVKLFQYRKLPFEIWYVYMWSLVAVVIEI